MASSDSANEPIADREVVITRTFDAPEIVPNRKIVFDNAFETPGAEKMIMTVTFEEKDGRTTLTLHTLFATAAMKKAHVGSGFVEGTGSAYDQLVDVVAGLKAKEKARPN